MPTSWASTRRHRSTRSRAGRTSAGSPRRTARGPMSTSPITPSGPAKALSLRWDGTGRVRNDSTQHDERPPLYGKAELTSVVDAAADWPAQLRSSVGATPLGTDVPAIGPASGDAPAELTWSVQTPYPIVETRLTATVLRNAGDVVEIYASRHDDRFTLAGSEPSRRAPAPGLLRERREHRDAGRRRVVPLLPHACRGAARLDRLPGAPPRGPRRAHRDPRSLPEADAARPRRRLGLARRLALGAALGRLARPVGILQPARHDRRHVSGR